MESIVSIYILYYIIIILLFYIIFFLIIKCLILLFLFLIRWNKQAWWTREKIGEYFPIFSHDHPPLIEYLSKMKIIQDKPVYKAINEPLKLLLDSIRSLVHKIEASLFLWGVFTAGCTIIVTSYNNSVLKKK